MTPTNRACSSRLRRLLTATAIATGVVAFSTSVQAQVIIGGERQQQAVEIYQVNPSPFGQDGWPYNVKRSKKSWVSENTLKQDPSKLSSRQVSPQLIQAARLEQSGLNKEDAKEAAATLAAGMRAPQINGDKPDTARDPESTLPVVNTNQLMAAEKSETAPEPDTSVSGVLEAPKMADAMIDDMAADAPVADQTKNLADSLAPMDTAIATEAGVAADAKPASARGRTLFGKKGKPASEERIQVADNAVMSAPSPIPSSNADQVLRAPDGNTAPAPDASPSEPVDKLSAMPAPVEDKPATGGPVASLSDMKAPPKLLGRISEDDKGMARKIAANTAPAPTAPAEPAVQPGPVSAPEPAPQPAPERHPDAVAVLPSKAEEKDVAVLTPPQSNSADDTPPELPVESPAVDEKPVAKAVDNPAENRGFWSRMFGSDDKTTTAEAAPPVETPVAEPAMVAAVPEPQPEPVIETAPALAPEPEPVQMAAADIPHSYQPSAPVAEKPAPVVKAAPVVQPEPVVAPVVEAKPVYVAPEPVAVPQPQPIVAAAPTVEPMPEPVQKAAADIPTAYKPSASVVDQPKAKPVPAAPSTQPVPEPKVVETVSALPDQETPVEAIGPRRYQPVDAPEADWPAERAAARTPEAAAIPAPMEPDPVPSAPVYVAPVAVAPVVTAQPEEIRTVQAMPEPQMVETPVVVATAPTVPEKKSSGFWGSLFGSEDKAATPAAPAPAAVPTSMLPPGYEAPAAYNSTYNDVGAAAPAAAMAPLPTAVPVAMFEPAMAPAPVENPSAPPRSIESSVPVTITPAPEMPAAPAVPVMAEVPTFRVEAPAPSAPNRLSTPRLVPIAPTMSAMASPPPVAPSRIASRPSKDDLVPMAQVNFLPASQMVDGVGQSQLKAVAEAMQLDTKSMLMLNAYANSSSSSEARRISLNRALAVRSKLAELGIQPSRIEVNALGDDTPSDIDGSDDRVDAILH